MSFLFILLIGSQVLALDPQKVVSQYVHDSWQFEDGLPQNSAQCIVQTRDGYLWIGTEEGLARFDGVRFKTFNRFNTKEIQQNWINGLEEDKNGNLWVGTDGSGLLRYKAGKFERILEKEIDKRLWPILVDSKGNIWVGSLGSGLYRIQNDKLIAVYTTKDGLATDYISSIFEDKQGNILVGTPKGVSAWNNGKFSLVASGHVSCLLEDRNGNLWVGSRSDGLRRIRNGEVTLFTTKDGLFDNGVWSLLEDRSGNLWIGTNGGSLSRFKNGSFESFQLSASDQISTLYEDREGSVWIGLIPGGLHRLSDGKLLTYGVEEGLPGDRVWSVHENKSGDVWIGTSEGAAKRQSDGSWFTYTQKNGLSSANVMTVYEDREGYLWIGTESDGVNRCKDGKCATYKKSGTPEDYVWSMLEDRNGGMWIGTSGGGAYYTLNGKFTPYTTAQGLSDNLIHAILQDQDGSIWFGTERNGLSHLVNGKIRMFTAKDGLSNNHVLCLYKDSDGVIWIGTRDGLNRYKNGKFVHFTRKDGLFDDLVHNIVEDDYGNFWMSCNRGLFHVAKKDLNDFAAGKIKAIHSVSYGKPDGMRTAECIGSIQPGAAKTKDGKLWFPTLHGVVVADPGRIKKNPYPPPVHIEAAIVDREDYSNSVKPLSLSPGKEKFEFQYTATSLLISERVRFKYRLEGFDKDWVDAGNRRVAYYTNIRPGHYRFHVIASNNDDLWNETGDSFSFYLEPYFYQTPWFYALCAVLTVLASLSVYRYRMKKVKAEFSAVIAERSRIARDLHDTLAQSLTGILLQLDAAEDSENSRAHVSRAQDLARKSLEEARRTVWALRPQELESSDLVSAITALVEQMKEDTSLDIQFRMQGAKQKLPLKVEQHILRIAQEAVTNSVKHAAAKQILLNLNYQKDKLELFVQDDGHGFNPTTASKEGHFGLMGMKERAAQIGGRIEIQSESGKGTEIKVTIPV